MIENGCRINNFRSGSAEARTRAIRAAGSIRVPPVAAIAAFEA
jgi:hypothetical protein